MYVNFMNNIYDCLYLNKKDNMTFNNYNLLKINIFNKK